ncbi:hypothetical protein A2U01_0087967, partial [Trifolium medium]|nr:hypothetical protein [Trifolium medium]
EVFNEKLIGHVVDFAKSGTDPTVPEEAVWAISTAAVRGSDEEILS